MIGLAGAAVRAEEAAELLKGIYEGIINTPHDLEKLAMDLTQVAENVAGIADYVEYRIEQELEYRIEQEKERSSSLVV